VCAIKKEEGECNHSPLARRGGFEKRVSPQHQGGKFIHSCARGKKVEEKLMTPLSARQRPATSQNMWFHFVPVKKTPPWSRRGAYGKKGSVVCTVVSARKGKRTRRTDHEYL